jgi:hypothetical protein
MTVQPTPGLGWRQRRFISPRLARILAGIMMLIGVTAPIGGIAYAINGATQAQGPVKFRVVVTEPGALQVPVSGAAGPGTRPLHPQGVTEGDLAVSFDLTVPSAAASSFLEVPRELTLRAWDSTVTEQLFSRAAAAVLGLCIGLGAVLLRRVLLSVADGQPFRPGNPACLAGIAALMVVASLAAAVLPAVASARVLDRLALDAAASPIASPPVNLDLGPLLATLVVLALAEAFRRGGELAHEVEGLI